MKNNIGNNWVSMLILITILSCGPQLDEVMVDASVTILPTQERVEKILMLNEKVGYAVGGKQFGQGFIAYTNDGWVTYSYDSMGSFTILDIACEDEENCLAVGFFSKLYFGSHTKGWQERTLPNQKRFSGIGMISKDNWMVVGGSGLGDGVIHRLSGFDQTVQTQDSFIHELADVEVVDKVIHVVGYGLIMKSDDGGDTWIGADSQGDFYVACSFPSKNIGYAVGEFGSVLKTSDGGSHWTKKRDGNLLWVKDLAFQDVYFADEEHGIISGKGGLCWSTKDGGDTWEKVKGIPKLDYFGIHGDGSTIWLGGNKGRIVEFQLPE